MLRRKRTGEQIENTEEEKYFSGGNQV